MDRLKELDVLISGLAFTSRTETLEDYLKGKVNSLAVIAVSSCFLRENLSRVRIYEKGILKKEYAIANFRIRDYAWYRQPLVVIVFIVNWFSIITAALRLGNKFDLYIGISSSFACAGVILKKIGRVKKLVYYCIDYYIPPRTLDFNALFVRMVNFLERFVIKNAAYVWDLSPQIGQHRQLLGGIPRSEYRNSIVPLGYSRHLRRIVPFKKINRWDIGFVGTVSRNHGLEVLAEAMPEILKSFPQLRVKIIGHGPFLEEFKEATSRSNLSAYFTFFGFIKEEERMLDILSHCALALAIYTRKENNNITCADTGKPKLYALLGLPMIVTRCYPMQEEIQRRKAGMVIDDGPMRMRDELIAAVSGLLSSDALLEEYRQNAYGLGEGFICDAIFERAFGEMEVREDGL